MKDPLLPTNAQKIIADRKPTLWEPLLNFRERAEIQQLCENVKKRPLPTNGVTELCVGSREDMCRGILVDKGMCADWAIHDSENGKGHGNLPYPCFTHACALSLKMGMGSEQKKNLWTLTKTASVFPSFDKKTSQQKVDKRNRKPVEMPHRRQHRLEQQRKRQNVAKI